MKLRLLNTRYYKSPSVTISSQKKDGGAFKSNGLTVIYVSRLCCRNSYNTRYAFILTGRKFATVFLTSFLCVQLRFTSAILKASKLDLEQHGIHLKLNNSCPCQSNTIKMQASKAFHPTQQNKASLTSDYHSQCSSFLFAFWQSLHKRQLARKNKTRTKASNAFLIIYVAATSKQFCIIEKKQYLQLPLQLNENLPFGWRRRSTD